MLRMECMMDAAQGVTTAALVGEGWEEALHRFAYASGAHGAVLMRNRPDRMLSAITTEEVAETVWAFAAGRAPPSSRYRVVRVGPKIGFRVDHDDYSQDQLNRDPFYQEFLRPAGFFWHANAALTFDRDECVELSLKRRIQSGPYQREDAVALNAVLGQLRAAARLATQTLSHEATGVATLLRNRGDALYQLDAGGRVLSTEAFAALDKPDCPISVIGRRLRSRDAGAQAALDRAVAMAVARPGATVLTPLTSDNTHRHFLQIVPVPGRARDIFHCAAAIAVVIDVRDPPRRRRLDPATIGAALALTDREANVACLLAEGLAPAEIAKRLRMQPSTARVHLRSIFEKTGTKRQAELVAFLGHLRP
ncbi:MAG: helix-turn-helix transcriptional regulator [Hyphomicrobiales bacterium]|nr:helix-turn-helix transcriptional regulator [Hyphomicrobiales bacterium]